MAIPAPDACVFVVDDDEAVRESLATLLRTEGLTVETHGSAQSFLDALTPDRVGCLVTDVRMPEMDGLTLLDLLVRNGRRMPVIVVTGHGDVALAVRAMKAGAFDFVEKPFADAAMLGSVTAALAHARASAEAELAAADVADRLAALTPREHDVLERLIAGRPNKVIAHELGISIRTVEFHRSRVMQKMRARSMPELVRMAISTRVRDLAT